MPTWWKTLNSERSNRAELVQYSDAAFPISTVAGSLICDIVVMAWNTHALLPVIL